MTGHGGGDLELLTAVARSVIELSRAGGTSVFRLPYPPGVQLALDRLVLVGLMRGTRSPAGVPELMSWCRTRVLSEWPMEFPVGFLTEDARLIHPTAKEPTRTCAELGSLGPSGGPDREAEEMLAGLAAACGTVERFARCRDFLIDRPVLLRTDPAELMRPSQAQVWNLVKGLYEPVPVRFVVEGLVYRCTGCGLLAKPVGSGAFWCEGGCPSEEGGLEASYEPRYAQALPFALRLFLALPGRTERVVRAMTGERAQPLLRGLGMHRLIGPDGMPRVFQAYDREQPVPAALRAVDTALSLGGPLDIVVPDRLASRPGYRNEFELALPVGAQVRMWSVSEFATEAGRSDEEERCATPLGSLAK